MNEQYRFNYRRTYADREGYYHTRWDRAKPVSVIAATEKEAEQKVWALSGEAPRGRYWTIILDKVEELAPCQLHTEVTS